MSNCSNAHECIVFICGISTISLLEYKGVPQSKTKLSLQQIGMIGPDRLT